MNLAFNAEFGFRRSLGGIEFKRGFHFAERWTNIEVLFDSISDSLHQRDTSVAPSDIRMKIHHHSHSRHDTRAVYGNPCH
jgi:hypothetical protein